MENELPKRKQNRLQNFDYSTNGAYFITICTREHKCILSHITPAVGADIIRPYNQTNRYCADIIRPCTVKLTKYGRIVKNGVDNITKIYPNCLVNYFVIMPNHVHLIITINNVGGRMISAPTVIGQFKRYVSKQSGISIWQKGFYDHIIRDEDDYITKAQYIENNPAKWTEDKYYNNN